MTDAATWVVAAGTVALAIATLALVWATRSLVIETRTQRHAQRQADVGVMAQPWEEVATVLAVTITNYGPANARDLRFTIVLREASGVGRREWTLTEPLFPAHRHRTTLIKEGNVGKMIEADLSVALEWSWKDANGESHAEQQVMSVAEIAGGLRGSGALLQRDYMREVPKIREALDKIARRLEPGA